MNANQRPLVATLSPVEFVASTEAKTMSQRDIQEFLQTLRKSKKELEIVRQQFETVVDPLLIDLIIFRLGAAEAHFNYLFQLARRWDICIDGIQWYWLENDEPRF